MSVDIDTLFEMMDEGQPVEVQEEALREARKIKSLSVFMQPIEYKLSWKNCAKVICEKTDEELNSYKYEMLEWLRAAARSSWACKSRFVTRAVER